MCNSEWNNNFWDGPEKAFRRVTYKGAGWSDDDIRTKPHIGIANAFAENSPAHMHLRMLAEAVKQGVWEAGGLPMEFGVPSTCAQPACDTEKMRYELAGRDAVAMAIEFVAEVHHFDGMVLMSSCDNIIPGTILAGIRTRIPSIVVNGGPMFPGTYKGQDIMAPDINISTASDNIPDDILDRENACCPGFGACPVMGTANTMQILTEVLGLSLPGTANIPATFADKIRAARESGRRAVWLAKNRIRMQDIITKEALDNATTVDLAIGGSSNAVLHILAFAYELGIPYSLDEFDKRSNVPCICGVKSAGPYSVTDLYYAGGVPAVEKILEPFMNLDTKNVAGTTLKDVIKDVKPKLGGVLHSLDDPFHELNGLTVLKGNLAENGAIIRTTGVPEEMLRFRGPAKCYNTERDATNAILNGTVKPGDVVVLRYEGCKGSPGMNELLQVTYALNATGLEHTVGLVTDGRFSGFNHGPVVGHVSPEAMTGGNLALVEDGDIVTVDCFKKVVCVEVDDATLAERRKHWKPIEPKVKHGLLSIYGATARPSHEGGAMQNWPSGC